MDHRRHFCITLIWAVGMTVYAFIMDQWHKMHYQPPIVRLFAQLLSYPYDTLIGLLAELNKANTREVVKQRLRARGETEMLQPLDLVSCCDVYVAVPQSIAEHVISIFGQYRYEYGESQSADVYLDRHFLNMGGPKLPMIRQSIMREAVAMAGRRPISAEEAASTLIFKLEVSPAALEFVMECVLFAHEGITSESQLARIKHFVPRNGVAAFLITLQAAACLSVVMIRLVHRVAVSPMEAIAAYYAVHILMNQIVRWWVGLPRSQSRPFIVYLDAHLWKAKLLPALERVGKNHAPGAAPSANPVIRKMILCVQKLLVCIMLTFSVHWLMTVGLLSALAGLIFSVGIAVSWPLHFKFKLESILSRTCSTNVLLHSALALGVVATAKHWSASGFDLKTLTIFGFWTL